MGKNKKEAISSQKSGYSLLPGTIFSDGDDLYLCFDNSHWYNISNSNLTVMEFINQNRGRVEKITSSTPLINTDDYITQRYITAGTIWLFHEKYYVAKKDLGH